MADLKQPGLRLPVHTSPQRRFSRLSLRAVGCALIVLGFILPCWGVATAQEEPNSLERRKADLEVEKLQLEVSKLKEDRREFPGWLAGVLGAMAGVVGTAAPIWVARRARLGELDQSVHDKRLESYPGLVKATAGLAIYFPNDDAPAPIDPTKCGTMGRAMSQWYFEGGGLLMSVKARDAYFALADALTRASLAEKLRVPIFATHAEEIGVEKVNRYRQELGRRFNLDDVENWSFGEAALEEEKPAFRFKDFVFLQRLSSTLRTRLSEDLRSRRRPS